MQRTPHAVSDVELMRREIRKFPLAESRPWIAWKNSKLKDTLFGKLCRGRHKDTNQPIIIKKNKVDLVLRKISRGGASVAESPLNEIRIHEELCLADPPCPYIVKHIDTCQDKDYLYQVLEEAINGDLMDNITQMHSRITNIKLTAKTEEAKTEERRYRWWMYEMGFVRPRFRQFCEAVHFIHKRGVCHRDISLENALLDNEYKCLMCDFGLAKKYPVDLLSPSGYNFTERGWVGKRFYTAPEMWSEQQYDASLADMWALAVILFALMFNRMPYKHAKVAYADFCGVTTPPGIDDTAAQSQLETHLRQMYRINEPEGINCSLEIVQFLTRMFHRAPEERYANMEELLADPVFSTTYTPGTVA